MSNSLRTGRWLWGPLTPQQLREQQQLLQALRDGKLLKWPTLVTDRRK